MNLKVIFKKLPLRYQRKFRPLIEKIFYLINLITLGQALHDTIGKVAISPLAKPFLKRSVAQQGEDLLIDRLLSRLLKINLNETHIYVDIGAFHAIDHSVTYLLYKRGWRGIAFDPSTDTKKSFKFWRPRDEFVCAAVGETDNTTVSFFVPKNVNNRSLSNTKYPSSLAEFREVKVHQVNLNEELKRRNFNKIDVLNIDVEGAELEILRSFNFDYFKPKIIALEIHGGDIQKNLETEEAKLILSKGYRCSACAVITYFFVREDAIN